MPPKRLDGLWLFGLALVVNLGAAYFTVQPTYMDAYYYFDGALRLARGLGFTEPYLWNYLDPVLRLPHPSHLYWMPLTSLAAAPFVALAEQVVRGASQAALFRAAQAPMVLAASALPLLSYAVAAQVSPQRRHAIAAALLTTFSAFYLVFWGQTDSFALYGLVAAGALLAGQVGVSRPSAAWLFGAGVCAGLAHLARNDGVLVLPVLLGVVLYSQRKGRGTTAAPGRRSRPWADSLAKLLPCLGGYALIMIPWMARNVWVMGAPLVPGGTRLLWLTDYNDLFSYPASDLTLARYLAAGWGAIVGAKWSALVINAGNLLAAVGDIVAFPFMLAGLWVLRRQPLFIGATAYGICLFGLMTFAFNFQGARGGFFHSATALLPFAAPAAVVGLDAAVEAAARVLKHWRPEKSKPIFTALLVLCAAGVTGLVLQQRLVGGDWRHPALNQADTVYGEIGRCLDVADPAQALVAVNNPPGFYYFTGRPSVVIPNGDPDALRRVARDFGVRWVVLDANVPDGLRDLYARPDSQPGFRLRQTFMDAAGRPVYVLEAGN
jgi:hypothetical protein